MRIFSGSDREIFEDMCIAIELCTESTEMLFRKEFTLEIPDWIPCPHCGRLMISSAKTCGNYCRWNEIFGDV